MVLRAHTDALQIVGSTLRSEGIPWALMERHPLICAAYNSAAGNLIAFISQPIFGQSGELLGVVGGSVYLLKQSSLHGVKRVRDWITTSKGHAVQRFIRLHGVTLCCPPSSTKSTPTITEKCRSGLCKIACTTEICWHLHR